jgi:hypothetical protein
MGKEDVRQALAMMVENPDVGDAFATGDFSAASGLELTEHEQTLVQDAASDLPDVAGFVMGTAQLGTLEHKHKYDFKFMPTLGPEFHKFSVAVDYIKFG